MKILTSMKYDGLCKCVIAEINKDDAQKMLDNKGINRDISKRQVELYTRSMNDGKWKFNGEGFTIGPNGDVKSGRHRLSAFIQSNLNRLVVLIIYLFNDDEILFSLNKGRPMATNAYLKIKGFNNFNTLSAVAKMYMAIRDAVSSTLSFTTNIRRLDYEIENEINNTKSIGMFVSASVGKSFRPSAPAIASFAYAYDILDKNRKDELFRSFVDICEMSTPRGTLARAVIITLNSLGGRGGQVQREVIAKVISHIIIYFENGRPSVGPKGIEVSEFKKRVNSLIKSK